MACAWLALCGQQPRDLTVCNKRGGPRVRLHPSVSSSGWGLGSASYCLPHPLARAPVQVLPPPGSQVERWLLELGAVTTLPTMPSEPVTSVSGRAAVEPERPFPVSRRDSRCRPLWLSPWPRWALPIAGRSLRQVTAPGAALEGAGEPCAPGVSSGRHRHRHRRGLGEGRWGSAS